MGDMVDDRVIRLLERYFEYQQSQPLDFSHTDWRGVRHIENLLSIYWLYNRTKDAKLLQLAEKIFQAGFDWTTWFLDFPWKAMSKEGFKFRHETHVVNIAMAIKNPGVWYQQSHEKRHKRAVYEGIANLGRYHGQATGLFSGDEHLNGLSPASGTELCAVIEFMFSLENLISIFGDPFFGDYLEKLTFNALPAAFKPDMWAHQYDQQANQVLCTIAERNWVNNGPDSNIFGLEPNFGCCTANMHQGWPKFAKSLWMACEIQKSEVGVNCERVGLAAIAYAPCKVKAKVKDDKSEVEVEVEVITDYPFDEKINVIISTPHPVEYPLKFRIPAWAKDAKLFVNNQEQHGIVAGSFHTILRTWGQGDKDRKDRIELIFPMKPEFSFRYNNAVSIQRGPLLYALKVSEDWKKVRGEEPHADWEVYPASPWNYALIINQKRPEESTSVVRGDVGEIPFSPDQAPVCLKMKGRELPEWQLVKNSAGEVPISPVKAAKSDEPVAELTLIPYGCTNLRITEFPYFNDN